MGDLKANVSKTFVASFVKSSKWKGFFGIHPLKKYPKSFFHRTVPHKLTKQFLK